MKVGYVVNSYPMPSHSFIRREIRALERQGVEVHRFSMRTDRDRLVEPADLEELERTEIVLEATGALGLAKAILKTAQHDPAGLVRAARMTMHLCRRTDAGIIRNLVYLAEACYLHRRFGDLFIAHAHAHFGSNPTTVALLMHALGGVSYSFTVHGPEEFDRPMALAIDKKLEHCAFAVGVSSFGRSQLCRWARPESWDKIKVVHCGIEPSRFDMTPPMPDAPLRLISIGRFVEQKGQLVLIDALARHRAAGGEATLTLVGDGPMQGMIEDRIAEHGLEAAVRLTGWVAEAEVEKLLADSHLLAMPSFAEGLPMVMMEAMAMGRPVLGTYVAGIPELVTEDTGWLVPAGDVPAMAQMLDRIAALPLIDLRRMGDVARGCVFERHDVNNEAGRLRSHLQAVSLAGVPDVILDRTARPRSVADKIR